MKKHAQNCEIPASSKIKFEESEENDSSSEETDDEEARIESELADVPFEELHKARSDGSLAIPLRQKRDPENKPKRANKNRPMEVSCKRPVSRYREVVQVPKQVARDPRFESLCGTFDEEGFKKRYNFIYEESLPAEKEELKKLLRSTKDPKGIEDLKNRISMIDKQLKSDSTKLRKSKILSEQKRRVREAVKQGKRPFYIKKSEIRERVNIEKYENLKASGKLDSYMEKKRRRTASKDHRFMPYRMSNKDE